jgi:hypothetical protein
MAGLDRNALQHYCCKDDSWPRPSSGIPLGRLAAWAAPGNPRRGQSGVRDKCLAVSIVRRACGGLGTFAAGRVCDRVLDGSYVTGKPRPGDFDACWDPSGVEGRKLDPVFLEFGNRRAAQKAAFKGEFFPSSMMCADVGQAFIEFFQLDRSSGNRKGIISISLLTDPVLLRKAQP